MWVFVSDAKGQLTELVRRAEAGEGIILTRHGHAAVKLVSIEPVVDARTREALPRSVRASAAVKAAAGPSAVRSHDFPYGDDGLPE